MRVGIHYPFPLYAGGGEKYLLRVAQILAEENQVDFYCPPPVPGQELAEKLSCRLDDVHFLCRGRRPIGTAEEMVGYLRKPYDLFVEMTSHVPRVASLGRRGILTIQFPEIIGHRSPIHKLRTRSYDTVWCYSHFTRDWILRRRGREAHVVYPPVDTAMPLVLKQNIILSVGRFFAGDHNKKHLTMIEAFKALTARGLRGWEYHLVGSAYPPHGDYLETVRRAAEGAPIYVHTDMSGHQLRELYAKSRLFWHATGYGEDAQAHPERLEHFGITTVEAMAAGAVPLVYAAGGQTEIVQHGKDGILWREPEGLIAETMRLATEPALWAALSDGARQGSRRFSSERFRREVLCTVQSLL